MKLNKQAKLPQKPPLSFEWPSNALLRYADELGEITVMDKQIFLFLSLDAYAGIG